MATAQAAHSIDIGNLSACVEDARLAGVDQDPGLADPTDYEELQTRLLQARGKLPPLYRHTVHDPFAAALAAFRYRPCHSSEWRGVPREGHRRLSGGRH
jgi:hypothetical protein